MSRGQRFILQGKTVGDQATGLVWSRSANPAGWPLFWGEANDYLAGLNQDAHLGFNDWRLPNRRELFSLMDYAQANPALPVGHPFTSVELAWYWSATPYAANPAYAWYLHTEGGRMFFGDKGRSYYVWPVRGKSPVLPVTGGPEPASGIPWPQPRWEARGQTVRDRLGGLIWSKCADLAPGPVSWFRAMELAQQADAARLGGLGGWRLPAIAELELLVDSGRAFPAIDPEAPFSELRPQYWSATTSGFDPDWAMALYLDKGGVGVGMKKDAHYHVWLVSDRNGAY
ncbi:MAG: DUF1566 domain-containing protein [Desulfarculus sp.]|nr:DUF1566 domain-containing protein [Pseudomonadota bacterium]MBV1716271.1 DUF1566 domain-containing protein [Desulfarculus sp.]MBU4574070.1 DUF1566 domain-containing protein [Pseudomonadota bacterium]MBU4599383.1 DUF1566 domain-containing protein [Pseudomonadota bacterium]MBV1737233.1 DUF1566 domain-containing protein [Desulfarculus sp.]